MLSLFFIKQESYSTGASFTAILELKYGILASYFQYLSAKTLDAVSLSNQFQEVVLNVCVNFVAIIVRASIPALYSRISPYGHLPYTHSSLYLQVLQEVHLVSDKPEFMQSLPLYYGVCAKEVQICLFS